MKQDFKVYARLLSYLKPYWGAALLVLVGFGINASTEVSVAKLLEYIINAIQHQNQQNLNWFPFLVIILIFFRGLGLFIGGYYTAVISRSLIFRSGKRCLPNYCVYLPSIIWTIIVARLLPKSCITWSNLQLLLLNL